MHLVLAFSQSNNLKKQGIVDLLHLIKLHLPATTNYPTSTYKLESTLNVKTDKMKNYFYCDTCENVLSDNFVCSVCAKVYNDKSLREQGKFFILYDLPSHFELLLGNEKVKLDLERNLKKRKDLTRLEVENI